MKIDPCSIKGQPGRIILSPKEYEIVDKYKLSEEDWGKDGKTHTGRFKTYYNEETGLELPNPVICKAIYLSGNILGYYPDNSIVGGIAIFDDGFFDITTKMPYPSDEDVLVGYMCHEYNKNPNEELKTKILTTGISLVRYNIKMPIFLIRTKCLLNHHFKSMQNLLINVDHLNHDAYLARDLFGDVCEEDLDEYDR